MKGKIGRNDQCPCGSGKKYKKCCITLITPTSGATWIDEEGLHIISKGTKPSDSEIEKMTKKYQNQVRNSPMWDEMVSEFGKEKAEELLKEFKAKVK
ncbi:MAG: SEC-C domain-containing protein [Colwellia sp.]|nr:SEC-C domain-containing protein [Colwellia sp.]